MLQTSLEHGLCTPWQLNIPLNTPLLPSCRTLLGLNSRARPDAPESLPSQLPSISLATLIPVVGQGRMAYRFSSNLESSFSSAKFCDCRVGTSWLEKQLNMHELELLLDRKCSDFIHVDSNSSLMDNTAFER